LYSTQLEKKFVIL